MCIYQSTLTNSEHLDSTIALLEQTSVLVDIFSNNKTQVDSMDDVCTSKIFAVLQFFHNWEESYDELSIKCKSVFDYS